MDPEGDTRREHVFTSGGLLGTNTRRHRAVTLVSDLFIVFNYKTEKFTGENADKGNALLHYEMRKEFAVPDQV